MWKPFSHILLGEIQILGAGGLVCQCLMHDRNCSFICTLTHRMESLAGPLMEGMVVSRRSLSRLVRLTAANMCGRHRLDNEGYVSVSTQGLLCSQWCGLKCCISSFVSAISSVSNSFSIKMFPS